MPKSSLSSSTASSSKGRGKRRRTVDATASKHQSVRVSESVQEKIRAVIGSLLAEGAASPAATKRRSKGGGASSGTSCRTQREDSPILPSINGSAAAASGAATANTHMLPSKDDHALCSCSPSVIRSAFEKELDLPHVDAERIRACGNDADQLQQLAEAMHVQTQSAIRVFELLDADGKGVVVLEDLQRVAPDILGTGGSANDAVGGGSGGGSGKDSWTDDDLVQMVAQVDRSGDGLLTKDDMIRIARVIGL